MIPFACNPVSHAGLKVGILALILLLVPTIQLEYKIPDKVVLVSYLIVSWLFIAVTIHNIVLFRG